MPKQNQQKKRPYYGGGMPKGHRTKKVLDREAAEKAYQQIVMEHARPMVEAQVANAQGVKYLIARNKKTGKFVPLTEATAAAKLVGGEDDGDEVVELWAKDPNVSAFTDLMNRTFGKPAEKFTGEFDVNVTLNLEERIKAARKRG